MKQDVRLQKSLENLEYKEQNLSFSRILKESNESGWIQRPFNNEFSWTAIKSTFFIESVLLRCEMMPIIILRTKETSIICDGYNRLVSLIQFFKNELALSEQGLKQLSFLANKKFKDLPPDYQSYLLQNCTFKIGIYVSNFNENFTQEDYEKIEKQLYIRHNTGIQLKSFQIQKAKFCNDDLTEILSDAIVQDTILFQKLNDLKILKQNNGKNCIDIGMVKIRSLLASTYTPLDYYLRQKSSDNISENCFIPYVKNKNKNEVITQFLDIIEKVHTLFLEENISNYPTLYQYRFIEATYWLIGTIIIDQLLPIETFDQKGYIQYCLKQNTEEGYFSQTLASYSMKKETFQFVAHYLEQRYGKKMSHYFTPTTEIKKTKNIEEIPLFNELFNLRYITIPEVKDVEEVCSLMQHHCFLLRPYYQRNEEKKIREASGIIESCMLDIRIPNILIYRYFKNGKQIYEVVDGQQRCLSLLAYLGLPYLNEKGDFEKTEKNHFSLQKLRVLKQFNQYTYHDTKLTLPKEYQKKIRESDIHLSIIDQNDNPDFDPIEHYIRINSNINPLKTDSYAMWNVANDKTMMERINEVTREHFNHFFPSKSRNKNYETFITICTYHEFQNKKLTVKTRKWRNVSNRDLTLWLENIDDNNRFIYLDCVEMVHQNLNRIEKWLEFIDETTASILVGGNYTISIQRLDFFYYLLSDIEDDLLFKKHRVIEERLKEFVLNIKEKEISLEKKQEYLQLTKTEYKQLKYEFYREEKVLL